MGALNVRVFLILSEISFRLPSALRSSNLVDIFLIKIHYIPCI